MFFLFRLIIGYTGAWYAEMGVKGLTKFIKRQDAMLEKVQLHDTKVIIDGAYFMFYMYTCYQDLDYQHGGEYEAYEDKCRLFITNLQKCKIDPRFVFDGANDIDDKKLATLKGRGEKNIRIAGEIADGKSSEFLRPLLTGFVLRQVLTDLGVPFATCDFEADNEIVALANAWKCPVLANDSDFFVMDIEAGYFPLDTLDWKDVRQSEGIYFLRAHKYTFSKFCKVFMVKQDLVPLLATLSGNDYVDKSCFKEFLDHMYSRYGHGHFYSTLSWLTNQGAGKESIEKTKKKCIDEILRYVEADQRAEIQKILGNSFMIYQPSDASNLFDHIPSDKVDPIPSSFSKAKIPVPSWCQASLRNGKLPSGIINVMCTLRVRMAVQVDSPTMKSSSNEASLWIRRVVYGVLLRDASETSETPPLIIMEDDRKERKAERKPIHPVYDVPGFGKVLKLQDIPSTDESTRRRMLLATLAVKLIDATIAVETIDSLPPCFHLPVFVVMYWITHADPKANINHLRALLLCWVHNFVKHSQKDYQTSSTCKDPSWDFSKTEAQAVLNNNFWIHVESKTKIDSSLNLEACHGFSQFQGCLGATFHLNAALQYPYPAPDVTMLYSGKMVHCLYGIMQDIPGRHKPITYRYDDGAIGGYKGYES